jgi:hypothetical protein
MDANNPEANNLLAPVALGNNLPTPVVWPPITPVPASIKAGLIYAADKPLASKQADWMDAMILKPTIHQYQ